MRGGRERHPALTRTAIVAAAYRASRRKMARAAGGCRCSPLQFDLAWHLDAEHGVERPG
jgi:hypothetical protein